MLQLSGLLGDRLIERHIAQRLQALVEKCRLFSHRPVQQLLTLRHAMPAAQCGAVAISRRQHAAVCGRTRLDPFQPRRGPIVAQLAQRAFEPRVRFRRSRAGRRRLLRNVPMPAGMLDESAERSGVFADSARFEQFAAPRSQCRHLLRQLVPIQCRGLEFGFQPFEPLLGLGWEKRQDGDVGDLVLNFPNLVPGRPNAFQQAVAGVLPLHLRAAALERFDAQLRPGSSERTIRRVPRAVHDARPAPR